MRKLSVPEPDQVKASIEVSIWFCYRTISKSEDIGQFLLVWNQTKLKVVHGERDSADQIAASINKKMKAQPGAPADG